MRPSAFRPRIYHAFANMLFAEWCAQFDRCAAMGFDHVLLHPGAGSHAVNAVSDFDGSAERSVAALAGQCDARKLKLMLTLEMALPQRASIAHANFPEDLPDPRRPALKADGAAASRLDRPKSESQLFDSCLAQVRIWMDAGIAGFQCKSLARLSPAQWKRLIAESKLHNHDVRFLAWTPGCRPELLDQLRDCGFDATFSSLAWWDYRSGWLAEEYSRLSRIAPPIAFPEPPAGPHIASAHAGAERSFVQRLYERALWASVLCGDGILIPMGFEYGLAALPDSGRAFSHPQGVGEATLFDLSPQIRQANAQVEAMAGVALGNAALTVSNGPAGVTAVTRNEEIRHRDGRALFALLNPSVDQVCRVNQETLNFIGKGRSPASRIWPFTPARSALPASVVLQPGELQLFAAKTNPAIVIRRRLQKRSAKKAAAAPRIAIESVAPAVEEGKFPVKRVVGELVRIDADLLIDGHDKLGAALVWRADDEKEWHRLAMRPADNDRWFALLSLTRVGRHLFTIEAWRDRFATYRDALQKKFEAGANTDNEREEGQRLLDEAKAFLAKKGTEDEQRALNEIAVVFRQGREERDDKDDKDDGKAWISAMLSPAAARAMDIACMRDFVTQSETTFIIDSERPASRFASWYELFPRSQSGEAGRHGTFADVIERLPAIRDMGFDTLYFPPIHPIGRRNRKGRNNSLVASEDDPGSPYAIGSSEGGHCAIHPELGTLADFRLLLAEAATYGLEIALDFAVQCAPDHPWLRQHPEWFDWLPDGSIRYAENPPKKYEDIVNVDFYGKGAVPDLWVALRDIVVFWINEGIAIFRVDNPHTKPLPFWEWLIADVRSYFPDVIFLAEAFTRPKLMHRLAKIGFSQSYTYFTWRHTKAEFIEYLSELAAPPACHYFGPHFFVNTPDINPYFLQRSGRPGFLIRATLAATLSGLWGIYSGFELCESGAVPGKEEYSDSEKYQLRAWDWQRPGNIIDEIALLNRIRRENPALQTHLGIEFHHASDDAILYFSKSPVAESHAGFRGHTILAAINLDPFNEHHADIELPLWKFGLPDDGGIEVTDLVHGHGFTWHGKRQHVRLNPLELPFAIWRIEQQKVST